MDFTNSMAGRLFFELPYQNSVLISAWNSFQISGDFTIWYFPEIFSQTIEVWLYLIVDVIAE